MDGIPDWVFTLGVLALLALVFGGVNIGAILLILGGIIALVQVCVFEPLERRQKRKMEKARESK